ncbi:MAG: hypothetical protein IJK27_01050 [Bacilli bacterium]|nr:hypothetical protein [Bacilli bacterium]
MKAKHVFLTMGLSLVMGLGVAAGMSANREVKAANAAGTSRLYFDVTSTTWWNNAGALTYAYCHDGATSPSWPGVPMTKVAGETYKYYVDIDSAFTKVIFCRVDPNDLTNVWNRTSKDGGISINLPSDYTSKNQWNLTADGTNYDDGNYCGNWSLYTPPTTKKVAVYVNGDKRGDEDVAIGGLPEDPEYYGVNFDGKWYTDAAMETECTAVTASTTELYCATTTAADVTFTLDTTRATDKFADTYLYTWFEGHDPKTAWPGDKFTTSTFTVKAGSKFIINAGQDKEQTVNIDASAAANDKLFILSSTDESGHYETEWASGLPVYKVRRNNSEQYEYTFTLDEDDLPSGVKHQYSAIVPNAYRANELVFYKDGTKMTADIGVDVSDTNNIVGNVTDGFKIYHGNNSMKIYLKEYDDGCSLWGEGYAENEFYIPGLTDSPSKYIVLDNDFEPYGDYIKQYKSIALSIAVKGEAQDKYHVMDNGASTMQQLTAETAGQNNAYMTSGSYFNVHNACNTEVYIKMKTDLSLVIYIGGYVEQHVMTIGGQEIVMEPYEGGQYRATGVTLHAGDTLTSYEIDGVEKVSEVSAKVVGNNNLGADKKVIVDATADIYYNVANKTLHVSGLPTGGYHIIKNGTTLITMTHGEEAYGYDQYYSDLLTFAVNDTIKFVDTNGEEGVKAATVFSISKIDEADPQGKQDCFTYEETNQVIKCVTATSATVYLKINSTLGDKVYFGPVPKYVQDAYDFANAFNTAIEAVCTDVEDAETAAEIEAARQDLEDAWGDKAIEFEDLSEQAQGYLKGESAQSVAELRSFFEKYDRVYTYRKIRFSWNLSNFLERNFSNSAYINPIMINKANSVVMVSIIVSMVTLFVSAGVVLFLFKKKKHN